MLRERVFAPLGMTDTGFWVPAAKRDRFTTFYAPGAEGKGLRVLDRPDGWWSEPLKCPTPAAPWSRPRTISTGSRRGLTGILLTQRMVMSPEPTQVVRDFRAAAYDAIDD